MKRLRQLYTSAALLLWMLLPALSSSTLYADEVDTVSVDEVDTLSSQLDIIRNQERQIYYPGNGMVLNYILPGLLQAILVKTTPYVVLLSPLSEPLVIPLSKETDRLQPFYQINDVSELPAGDYYFSVILTVPDGDPLQVDDWYLGTYGRISHERIRISATASDAQDANRDGLYDFDIDVNGFTDPSLAAQLKENLIQINRHIFYPDNPLTLSYALPGRLGQVFSGRANAHLAIEIPGQSALLYTPLGARTPDALSELLNLPDTSSLPEGEYLLSVIFTRPGGNPANFQDWYMDIDPINLHQRIYISKQSSDARDADNDGFFDGDNNNDGINDISRLNQHIAGLCPNNDSTCVYGYLSLFIADMANMGDLLDLLCKEDKVCADSMQEQIIQDAFSANGNNKNAATVVCPTGDSTCVNQTAFLISQAKHNIKRRNAIFKRICSNINNPDICQNRGQDGWATLYQHIRDISKTLRIPLFKRICPEGIKCGVNGGFEELIKDDLLFRKRLEEICLSAPDPDECEDNWWPTQTLIFQKYENQPITEELTMTIIQDIEITESFCTPELGEDCSEKFATILRGGINYTVKTISICGLDDPCNDLVISIAGNMGFIIQVREASEAFCEGDIACLTESIPKVLALASLPPSDPLNETVYAEICQSDSACRSELDDIIDLESNLSWIYGDLDL